MKRVVSIGPGSSTRDHRVAIDLLGEHMTMEKIGTDGDLRRARALFRELDGSADAFGLANMDLHLTAGRWSYAVGDARKLVEGVTRTPVVDGSGIKMSWEPWMILEYLPRSGVDISGRRVMLVSSVDRYPLAEALVAAGAEVLFGDLMFGSGLPVPLRSLASVEALGRLLLPITARLPFRWLYPIGERQTEVRPRHSRFYAWADIIAGDYHYIRRSMPRDLSGKTVITQTITQHDVEDLRERGVHLLVTDFGPISGRSFATNVMQAAVVALLGRHPDQIEPDKYRETLLRAGVRPRLEWLQDGR